MYSHSEFVPGKKMPSGYLESELVGRGVRITRQRRVVLKIIEDAERHLNAATILELARKLDHGIDRVTVYRTLSLLKKHGLIDELDLLHMRGEGHYYETRPLRTHIHLGCLGCGAVTEFESQYFEKLKGQISREAGFQVAFARIEVGGYCDACIERRGRERAALDRAVGRQ
jgi:Fur family ferric uptake transcriptional regulator